MRSCLVIAVLLVFGCNRAPEPKTPPPSPASIFDEVVARPRYSNAIVQAEQDLPSDRWEEKPFHYNASRGDRVWAVAKPMLDEVTPRFKEMSVTNLVRSFKVVPYPYGFMTNQLGDVAECVYAVGNQLIINEIKSRPPEQLRGLRNLGSDKVMLVEGPQG